MGTKKVVALIQSRVGSSRLKNKALLPLAGKPMIAHVIERVRAIRGVDEVVLATSVNERDTALAKEGKRCGVKVFRGDEHDVLDRALKAAVESQADVVVRLTGDCPLLCPLICEQVLALYQSRFGQAYAWNDVTRSGYCDGTDAEVFSREMLQAAMWSIDPQDREHVTPYIRRQFQVATIQNTNGDLTRWKLSVDTQSDYDFVSAVYGHLKAGEFSLAATMKAVDAVMAAKELSA